MSGKIFHKAINRNDIASLEVKGGCIEELAKVKLSISDHFRLQFQKKILERVEFPSDFVGTKLNLDDGEFITRPFTEEEICLAVWDCYGSKSPGLDGFNYAFYNYYWSIIKEDLLRVFMSFILTTPWSEDAIILSSP